MSGARRKVNTEIRAQVTQAQAQPRSGQLSKDTPSTVRTAMPGATQAAAELVRSVVQPEARVIPMPDYPHGRGGTAITPMGVSAIAVPRAFTTGANIQPSRAQPPAQKMPAK